MANSENLIQCVSMNGKPVWVPRWIPIDALQPADFLFESQAEVIFEYLLHQQPTE